MWSSLISDAPPVYPTWYLHWLLFYYGNEIKLLWSNPETQQALNNGFKFDYYRLFESHGLLHFVLSVFIYMKCYFIQDFIVIKSSKKTQLQFVNCRAHATHRNAVSQAFGSNWKQNSWVDVRLPKFTCATFNGVGRIGTFPNCTHFNNSISQKLVSYLFWLSDTLCFEMGRG